MQDIERLPSNRNGNEADTRDINVPLSNTNPSINVPDVETPPPKNSSMVGVYELPAPYFGRGKAPTQRPGNDNPQGRF
jgi:hypothetical protein